jgi:hypothetical protein
MKSPSLGYEDDTTLSKNEVAQIQLVEAISLFIAHRFLPAITLAGAAEEILGNLLVRNSELPVIKKSTKAIEMLLQRTGLAAMGAKSEKEMVDGWNATRNSMKHLGDPEDDPITLNLCDDAYWMIRRALANAQKLQISISNAQDFESWIIINVNT